MDVVNLFVAMWLGHIVIAAWAVAPMAVIGRRRADWRWWETLVFVAPYWTWAALMASPLAAGHKSLANIGEAGNISFAIMIATAIRLAYGKRPHRLGLSGVLLAAVVVVAVATFLLTPLLPEVG